MVALVSCLPGKELGNSVEENKRLMALEFSSSSSVQQHIQH